MHPTSKKVSIQLTKIAGSLSICTQMLIILFPVWAGIKKEKLSQKCSKIKKSKQFDNFDYLINLKQILSTQAKCLHSIFTKITQYICNIFIMFAQYLHNICTKFIHKQFKEVLILLLTKRTNLHLVI